MFGAAIQQLQSLRCVGTLLTDALRAGCADVALPATSLCARLLLNAGTSHALWLPSLCLLFMPLLIEPEVATELGQATGCTNAAIAAFATSLRVDIAEACVVWLRCLSRDHGASFTICFTLLI